MLIVFIVKITTAIASAIKGVVKGVLVLDTSDVT